MCVWSETKLYFIPFWRLSHAEFQAEQQHHQQLQVHGAGGTGPETTLCKAGHCDLFKSTAYMGEDCLEVL